jgi:signal transduction histidine kinase
MKRLSEYHDPGGLLDLFKEIKTTSGEIRRLNQKNMEVAGADARQTASYSVATLGTGLATAGLMAALLAWQMFRTILNPIRAVTESARAISMGNLDQVMPVVTNDEVGQFAQAFNLMARHLREYRQSQSDQLLRAQRTSQATIDSFPDPVLVIDSEGRVEMANPAARRLLGVTPVQPGLAASGLWQPPEPLREPLTEALQSRRDYLPESFDRAILLNTSSGEAALLPRILTIRDKNDNTLGAAIVLQDVTRLRLLDQVKNNLVATASHELKTPLTGVRLAIHLLLEEAVGPLTSKQVELLLDARENSERLLAVVNNLLDLARLEQGSRQLDLRPESPRSLLQLAAESVRARAQDKSIEILLNVPDDLPAVTADAERIGHAFRNLLDNSLTYTDRGGQITLSAAADGDDVVLSVTDTGCGIPPQHLSHVFEKFFRVPGQTRGTGTGLGLAIVQEIVTAHGGTIACESQLGVGTTFRLRLPIAAGDCPQNYVFGHADGHAESSS